MIFDILCKSIKKNYMKSSGWALGNKPCLEFIPTILLIHALFSENVPCFCKLNQFQRFRSRTVEIFDDEFWHFRTRWSKGKKPEVRKIYQA